MSKKAKAATKSKRRLRPGELDGLVLGYMRQHKKELPLTPSAIGKGLGRSPGAVANCLKRLAKQGKRGVRPAKRKPRALDLDGSR